ncbi:hypothetical protein HEK616_75910 (plasmid) [Streptomyces nigrescens]|uniref:Uncharacterized protein n=2 Tax=Streptomyces TaxID=1883 RepID=A0ABM8A678_STRNI|nr:hypothetical protein [Streptomyces nigrescens]MEE4419171.1 hypothetical protein [Streptomyces sp. DSM 41528]BDM74104.1 hypothetical protein HEK616_75910 [Streptomyces nigrescens]
MRDPEASGQAREQAAQVQVEVTDCRAEDAHAVFGALNALFTSNRSTEDVPRGSPGAKPTVWAASVDVSEAPAEVEPRRLAEPVTVTLQGGYRAVHRLHAGLARTFTVQDVGSSSGDQEQELQLRLHSR